MTDRTFAEKLRARIDADPDLTEAGLAVKAGLSNAAIRKLLAGNTQNPRMDTAMKICRALGTTVEEFMSEAETPEEHEIVRLVSQLPAHLRQKLLGYGQGLLDAEDPVPPADGSADQSDPGQK